MNAFQNLREYERRRRPAENFVAWAARQIEGRFPREAKQLRRWMCRRVGHRWDKGYLSDRRYFSPLGRRVTHHRHMCLRCLEDGPWRLRLWAKEMLPGDESILQDLPLPTRWQSICRKVNNALAVIGLAVHQEGVDYFE